MKEKEKIGIFLAFAPEQSLKAQGIGRLLCFLLAAAKNSTTFVIAMPKWYEKQLMELFNDHAIEANQYDLLMTSKIPYLLRVKKLINTLFNTSFKKEVIFLSSGNMFFKKLSIFSIKVIKKINHFLIEGLTGSSLILFLSSAVTLMAGLFFILYHAYFILILFFVFFLLWKIFQHLPVKFLLSKIFPDQFFEYYRKTKKYLFWFSTPLKQFKNNKIAQFLYRAMRKQEMHKLVQLMNSQKEVKLWFIPALVWPEIEHLKATKVVAVPDVVFIDFPTLFFNKSYCSTYIYQKIAATIQSADHFICYSGYVKQKHLMEKFCVEDKKISIIPHGIVNLTSNLAKTSQGSMTQAALKIIQQYQKEKYQDDPYLSDFDFRGIKFIFYSSQFRPYKNFLMLFKAYEILLRHRYLNIKLIVTGNLEDPMISDFIKSRRLTYDILSFQEVSSEVLAALNHLAICSVNPTLFEGGFPFTFSEAYSVGTPSIMSHIPVVEEMIHTTALKEMMLFDPYNLNDMVEKIAWGVTHSDALYQAQKPLYEQFEKRSWEKVAGEYLKVFGAQLSSKCGAAS